MPAPPPKVFQDGVERDNSDSFPDHWAGEAATVLVCKLLVSRGRMRSAPVIIENNDFFKWSVKMLTF